MLATRGVVVVVVVEKKRPHTAVDVVNTKDFSIAYQRQHSGSC